MKISTKKLSTLLLSVCLGGVVSVAEASWRSCEISDNTIVGSGDYVCCKASIDEDDSVLTIGRGSGAHVVCMARNNKAWHWVYVGYESGCSDKFFFKGLTPYNTDAYRCEQQ
ncbi:MAG: hypothetical protein JSS53_00215 [Proteobacteria bacterium]|nr:hypothetical protein [Pseudomonadota bacterium]